MSKAKDNSKQDLVLIGRVTSVFGIKGWVNVYSYTDPAENILDYSDWLLSLSEGDGQNKRSFAPELKQCKKVTVSEGQRHGKKIIARLEQCESREKAGTYIQHDIFIERSELPELEDEIYWIDLEGLQVINLQGQVLGRIAKMLETGANDVMVVRSELVSTQSSSKVDSKADSKEIKEILIPYVEDHYVVEVNLEQGLVKVDWVPEQE